jgi:hypothetical protein
MSEQERRLGLSFSLKRGRSLIYWATIRSLKNPKFIRFLFNSRDHKVAIQVATPIDKEALKVPAFQEVQQYEIASKAFLRVLYKNCHWDESKTYRVYGTNYGNEQVVEFRLEEATIIRDEEFRDPEIIEP